MCSLAACHFGVGYRSIEAFKCYYGSLLTPSFRRSTASSGRTIKYLGPVHTYPKICENANFFILRIRLACTRIRRIFRPYPEIFENALQSGIFFYPIRIRIRVHGRIRKFANTPRHFLGSSLHVEHYEQTWRTARLIAIVIADDRRR